MKNLQGTWLMITNGFNSAQPMLIEFENDQVLYYEVQEKENGTLEKKFSYSESFSDTKNEWVNENRIRFYIMGRTRTILSETESEVEETEFPIDYERIVPTKTVLQPAEIEQLKFEIEWNKEKIELVFNKSLDSPAMQNINKRQGREGQKFVLEQLNETYFASMYMFGRRHLLIPIKEVDEKKVILYGFPKEPYEIICQKE